MHQWVAGLLAAACMYQPTLGQSSEGKFFLWQGFSQQWTYPHPPLRWGDGFTKIRCSAHDCIATHEQINSTQLPDRSSFFCRYTFCVVPGARAFLGKHTFQLTAPNGASARGDVELHLPADSMPGIQQNYIGVLAGFDLNFNQKAQKIRTFSIEVGDGYYSPEDRTIRIPLSGEIAAGQSGFNCRLTIYYLVLAGDGVLSSRGATFQRRYFWDKRIALEPQPQRVVLEGQADPLYELGIPTFRRIRFNLDRPHNFVATAQYLDELAYDPLSGKAEFTLNLQWRQWQDGMKASSRYRKYARRSARKTAGVADCYADVVLIQARQGCAEESEIRAENSWPGRPAAEPGDDIYRSSLQHLVSPECR